MQLKHKLKLYKTCNSLDQAHRQLCLSDPILNAVYQEVKKLIPARRRAQQLLDLRRDLFQSRNLSPKGL